MSTLSVVVADAPAGQPERCGAALRQEAAPGDQVVWVGAGPAPDWADAAVRTPARDRGRLYRAGLDAATHPLVSFTDTATVVQPGWRHAAVAALGEGSVAVGGPVLPASTAGRRRFAGFVVEYGLHAAAPYANASGDVAANNVGYDRAALEQVLAPGEAVWKTLVDARLAAAGRSPVVVPAMRVVSVKGYAMADLLAVRASHGRLHGAQQARRWSFPVRLARAMGCAALPAVSYGRLAARLAGSPQLRRPFVASSPLVVAALVAWSLGEAWGLCTGRASGDDNVF